MLKSNIEAIVLGGSAGSIEPTAEILARVCHPVLPPIVVVLHRMRNVKSSIDGLLKNKAHCDVIKEADEKEPLLRGMVYVAPANYHLLIEEDKTFCLDNSEPVNFSRPSIDATFESAALVYGKKLVGIMLSGSNSDGSRGLQSIERKGGVVVVQDPKEAEFSIMPESAIRSVLKPRIIGVTDIQNYLLSLIHL